MYRGEHRKRRSNLDLGLDGLDICLGTDILGAKAQVAQADDAHVRHYHGAQSRVAESCENIKKRVKGREEEGVRFIY